MIDRDRKIVDGRRRERRKEEYERRCLRVFKLVDSIPQPGLSVRFFRGRPRARFLAGTLVKLIGTACSWHFRIGR